MNLIPLPLLPKKSGSSQLSRTSNYSPTEKASRAKGDFDLTQHYVVTVSPDLKGQRGYGLPAQSKWGATFHPKDPCIIFASSELYLRALKELRLSFLQINTGPLQWKLARIPLEKLGAVNARLSEFEQTADQSIDW